MDEEEELITVEKVQEQFGFMNESIANNIVKLIEHGRQNFNVQQHSEPNEPGSS